MSLYYRTLIQKPKPPLILQVDTSKAGATNNDQFTVGTSTVLAGEYNYSVKTSDGNSVSGLTGDYTITFPSGTGIYDVEISGTFPALVSGQDPARIIDVKQWGGHKYKRMALTLLDTSITTITATDIPDLTLCTTFERFLEGSTVETYDFRGYDFTNVTNFNFLCRNTSSLTTVDFTGCNTSNITDLGSWFQVLM